MTRVLMVIIVSLIPQFARVRVVVTAILSALHSPDRQQLIQTFSPPTRPPRQHHHRHHQAQIWPV